jgi:hypothetical protein
VFPEAKLQSEVSSPLDQDTPTFFAPFEAGVPAGGEDVVVVEDGLEEGVTAGGEEVVVGRSVDEGVEGGV